MKFSEINKITIPWYSQQIKQLLFGLKDLILKVMDDYEYLENNCPIFIINARDTSQSSLNKHEAMIICLKRDYQKLEVNNFLEELVKAYTKLISVHKDDDYFLFQKQMLPINQIMFLNTIIYIKADKEANLYPMITNEGLVFNKNHNYNPKTTQFSFRLEQLTDCTGTYHIINTDNPILNKLNKSNCCLSYEYLESNAPVDFSVCIDTKFCTVETMLYRNTMHNKCLYVGLNQLFIIIKDKDDIWKSYLSDDTKLKLANILLDVEKIMVKLNPMGSFKEKVMSLLTRKQILFKKLIENISDKLISNKLLIYRNSIISNFTLNTDSKNFNTNINYDLTKSSDNTSLDYDLNKLIFQLNLNPSSKLVLKRFSFKFPELFKNAFEQNLITLNFIESLKLLKGNENVNQMSKWLESNNIKLLLIKNRRLNYNYENKSIDQLFNQTINNERNEILRINDTPISDFPSKNYVMEIDSFSQCSRGINDLNQDVIDNDMEEVHHYEKLNSKKNNLPIIISQNPIKDNKPLIKRKFGNFGNNSNLTNFPHIESNPKLEITFDTMSKLHPEIKKKNSNLINFSNRKFNLKPKIDVETKNNFKSKYFSPLNYNKNLSTYINPIKDQNNENYSILIKELKETNSNLRKIYNLMKYKTYNQIGNNINSPTIDKSKEKFTDNLSKKIFKLNEEIKNKPLNAIGNYYPGEIRNYNDFSKFEKFNIQNIKNFIKAPIKKFQYIPVDPIVGLNKNFKEKKTIPENDKDNLYILELRRNENNFMNIFQKDWFSKTVKLTFKI